MIENEEPFTQTVLDLAKSVYAAFAGYPAPVIGAALADLTSLWLAGHVVDGQPDKTRKWRADLFKEHTKAVRKLVPLQEAMLRELAEAQRPN